MYNDTTKALIETNRQYIPWNWTVISKDPIIHPCNPPASTFLAHGITICVTGILGVVVGHRRFKPRFLGVLKYLCRGLRASQCLQSIYKDDSSDGFWKRWLSKIPYWVFGWTIPFLIHAFACLFVAYSSKHFSKGYNADFEIGQYLLFLFQLPRGGHFFLFVFILREPANASTPRLNDEENTPVVEDEGRALIRENDERPSSIDDEEEAHVARAVAKRERSESCPWERAFVEQIISEIVLQILGLPTMLQTFFFGWKHTYFSSASTPVHAHMMYAGALVYIILVPVTAVFCGRALYSLASNRTVEIRGCARSLLLASCVISFAGSWLGYIGFVGLAGETYCTSGFLWQVNNLILLIFGIVGSLWVVL